jgi:hypothetical protein
MGIFNLVIIQDGIAQARPPLESLRVLVPSRSYRVVRPVAYAAKANADTEICELDDRVCVSDGRDPHDFLASIIAPGHYL